MAKLTIRRAQAGDWGVIAALHAASWRSAYRGIYPDDFLDHEVEEHRRAYWREHLPAMDGEEDAVFLAEEDGNPLGFACIRRRHDAHGPLLDNLHVLPERKGGGIGRQLLREPAAWLVDKEPDAALIFYVWAANPSLGFYRRLGAEEAEQFDEETPGGGAAPIIRMCWPRAAVLR